MPVCFQLYAKDKPGEGPVVLQKIDEEMCKHFEAECHPKHWFYGWFDAIGFRIAIGKTMEEIKAQFEEYLSEETAKNDAGGIDCFQMLLKILAWLDERYTTNSFYSPYKD